MIKKICNYFIIFLLLFIISCEERKKEGSANFEIKTKNIPTNEKVEYVFACMQGNEDSQAYLVKCSCSIDYIEEQMTYDEYVQAETIMSLRQIYGEKSLMFKSTSNAMEIYSNMHNILAEAELECF